jgi:carboxypeptidase C (cathepsin A)
MLYLESPVGVGFSYSANISDYFMVNDKRTGYYTKKNQHFTLILTLDFN